MSRASPLGGTGIQQKTWAARDPGRRASAQQCCAGVRTGAFCLLPAPCPQHSLLLTRDTCQGSGTLRDEAQAQFPSQPPRGSEGLPATALLLPCLLLSSCSPGPGVAALPVPCGWGLGWAPFLDQGSRGTPV